MLSTRTFNQSSVIYDGFIYAIGGNSECTCERYEFNSSQWQIIDSYTSVLKQKEPMNYLIFAFLKISNSFLLKKSTNFSL